MKSQPKYQHLEETHQLQSQVCTPQSHTYILKCLSDLTRAILPAAAWLCKLRRLCSQPCSTQPTPCHAHTCTHNIWVAVAPPHSVAGLVWSSMVWSQSSTCAVPINVPPEPMLMSLRPALRCLQPCRPAPWVSAAEKETSTKHTTRSHETGQQLSALLPQTCNVQPVGSRDC